MMSVSSASAAVTSPCKLVTSANAQHALGAAVGAGKLRTVGLYRSCTYMKGARSVIVLERKLTRSAFDTSAKKNPGPVVHVVGIGSDAYSAGGGSTLLLWKNGTELTVLVTGVSHTLSAEKTLGKIAASRL
jgi:hypothetical protein